MSRIARLQTFVSSGECFKLPGSDVVHVVPVQLFRTKSGTILRIGDTTFWFDENGVYDGPEFIFPEGITDEQALALAEKLDAAVKNRNRAPEKAYFNVDSDGHDAEVAEWPR